MNSFRTGSDDEESLAFERSDAGYGASHAPDEPSKRPEKERPAGLNGKPAPNGWSGAVLEETIVNTVVPRLRGVTRGAKSADDLLQSKSDTSDFGKAADESEAQRVDASVTAPSMDQAGKEVEAIQALIAALVAGDLTRAADICEPWFEMGGFEQTCHRMLTPAAYDLGRRWEDDTLDFARVTIAMTRLQHVLNEFAMREDNTSVAPAPTQSTGAILVTTPPGEQHVFGANMVAELFRRAGWEVVRVQSELALETVINQDFDLIGLSGSTEGPARAISSFVRTLRSQSKNRNIRVLFGGAALDPSVSSLADLADGYVADGALALKTAQKLLA